MIQDQKNNLLPELIETYLHEGEGYNPFMIRDNWQVAQLNYTPPQDLYGIEKMDMHEQTDEVFILTTGRAILIAAKLQTDVFSFQCIYMKIGITYNIPVNVWHNIAMDKSASMIIIEKSYTHTSDVIDKPLSEVDRDNLNSIIRELLISSGNN